MKSSTITLVVIIVIVIAGGAWYWYSSGSNSAAVEMSTQNIGQSTGTAPATTTQSAPMNVTVTYGPGGFSPQSVTVAKGGTVTWSAAPGADELWVASNPHPTHEGYDGTTRDQHCAAGYTGPVPFDQCAVGTTYSFTFDKVGTWGYHNHGNHSDTGTVIVQ